MTGESEIAVAPAAPAPRSQPVRGTAHLGAMIGIVALALGVVEFYRPTPAATEPFADIGTMAVGASVNAFGPSREVRLNFALPRNEVEFPIVVSGDPAGLTYEWVALRDPAPAEAARPVIGSSFIAPSRPGFYHLVIISGSDRQVIPEPTLAVMVPFERRVRGMLNGYRIGTYVADRHAQHDHPDGFLEVNPADVDLRVSTHLRLGDFLTHDAQADVWPKYVALNPRLLDKLELVFAAIGERARLSHPADTAGDLAFDVHSGFRTPAHNAMVWRAASDSRHLYGDAADLAIDANGDGRVTNADEALVARAVDRVEREYPDLVGGLGLYTSGRYRTPYVHIDTRGTRSRWKG